MDILSMTGMLLALVAILGGNILEGGHTASLVQMHSASTLTSSNSRQCPVCPEVRGERWPSPALFTSTSS